MAPSVHDLGGGLTRTRWRDELPSAAGTSARWSEEVVNVLDEVLFRVTLVPALGYGLMAGAFFA